MHRVISRVLAIETSCDDTSVAVVEAGGRVVHVLSANQDRKHRVFGGVVPEIAGRTHIEMMIPLIEECLQLSGMGWADIDGIAVTNRPGLVGSLIVGVVTAKSLSLALNKPLIGVNHLEAHLLAPFLKDETYQPPADFTYPFIALAISGGHTHLYHVTGLGEYKILGMTRDDAAGEAFDKFAKLAGLGFPGGVRVDKTAQDSGDPMKYDFPRALIHEPNYDFSFSGLKASAQRLLQSMEKEEIKKELPDLCASFQEAIVDVLIKKSERALKELNLDKVVFTGGVSANSRLRQRVEQWAGKKGFQAVIPPIRYCTDNAAMVGYVGIERLIAGESDDQSLAPSPRVYEKDFQIGTDS
tara:strand:+ start:102180 stop:103244 length:1065 start_codon:yes stop_codon:yes gene_type:complete